MAEQTVGVFPAESRFIQSRPLFIFRRNPTVIDSSAITIVNPTPTASVLSAKRRAEKMHLILFIEGGKKYMVQL